VVSFEKLIALKKFTINLEPVPYKALEGDPLTDLPLSQQNLLKKAEADARAN